MRTVVISDVHGTDKWKAIVAKETNAEKFIFLGDYFDNFPPHTTKTVIDNFVEILDFKATETRKVILLVGNHDYHYCQYDTDRYSGYNSDVALNMREIIPQLINNGTLQAAHQQNRYLFTHAGVTKTWFKGKYQFGEYDDDINRAMKAIPYVFGFNRLDDSGYGQSVEQSPIWVRPESLREDALENVIHVVGHTFVPEVTIEENFIFTDAPKSDTYLVIENHTPIVETL